MTSTGRVRRSRILRDFVFVLHLTVGAAAGVPVLVMAATGTILSTEGMVTAIAERRHQVAPPITSDPPARKIAPAFLLNVVREWSAELESPFVATDLRYRSDPQAPARVSSGRYRHVFVDPYRGEVVGTANPTAFYEEVREWHRWFNVPGRMVRDGRAVSGAANILFFLLLVTGPILWWPKRGGRRAFLAGFLFRSCEGRAARDNNRHRVVGVWSILPLSVIVLTGSLVSYPELADRVYPAAGQALPTGGWPGTALEVSAEPGTASEPARVESPEGASEAPPSASDEDDPDLGAVLRSAEEWVDGWQTLTLALPVRRDGTVEALIAGGGRGRPQMTGVLVVDAASGVPREWTPFSAVAPARRAREIFQHAHTGEYFGAAGQLAAGIFSLGACFMVWTGLSMAFRRLRRWRGRVTAANPDPASARIQS